MRPSKLRLPRARRWRTVAVDDFLLDDRVQRARHAVAGGAGKATMPKPRLSRSPSRPASLQVQLNGLQAGAREDLTQGLRVRPSLLALRASKAAAITLRGLGVGARGDGGDDHRAIGHRAFASGGHVPLAGDALGGQIRCGHASVRVPEASHVAHNGGQVERQIAFVYGRLGQAVRPQARHLGIGLDQRTWSVAAGQRQVGPASVGRCPPSRRSRRIPPPCWRWWRGRQSSGRAHLRHRTRDSAHDLGLAQELGQRQHHVGGGDARLALCRSASRRRLSGQAHPRGAAQHDVLGFQTAHADGEITPSASTCGGVRRCRRSVGDKPRPCRRGSPATSSPG